MPILIKLYNKKKWCYALVLRPFAIMTLDVVDSLRIAWSPILCKIGNGFKSGTQKSALLSGTPKLRSALGVPLNS